MTPGEERAYDRILDKMDAWEARALEAELVVKQHKHERDEARALLQQEAIDGSLKQRGLEAEVSRLRGVIKHLKREISDARHGL